ncbi:MAG TPA: hypothetical protein DDZ81_01625 [Acetobacteraceae bacterium]|jgi:O-antigen/teichoic acid export membrane protein|nr:hypothetical protein [Acetobacteraceae bacterium]
MRRDAFWSGLEAAVSACLSVITSFVIARLTGPAELGIGAAAVAVHVTLWVVVNALFADALVQRVQIDERIASSAFWASCAAGCLAMVLQAGAGWGLAAMFGDRRMLVMGLVLAAPLPLVGAAGAVQGLLTRERSYRHLALRTLIGQGLGGAVGLTAALESAGAWAFVWQQAATSAVGALALLLARGWRPGFCWDPPAVRTLLRVGVPLTASTLVSIMRYRLFALLIGGSAGAAALGQVHIAFRLVDTVRELVFTALWRLMLPALSEHQHDRLAMLAQVDRWLRRCLLVFAPLCAALAIGLTQVVTLLMGPNWAQAGQAGLPLVGLMAWSALTFPSGVALVAVGQVRFTLYANLGSLVLSAAGVLLVRPVTPWQAVMVWTISQVLVTPYAMWANARALRVGIMRPLSGGFGIRAPA